jgi:hypothetical protein
MSRHWNRPLTGVVAAIIITTAMDANGLSVRSFLSGFCFGTGSASPGRRWALLGVSQRTMVLLCSIRSL